MNQALALSLLLQLLGNGDKHTRVNALDLKFRFVANLVLMEPMMLVTRFQSLRKQAMLLRQRLMGTGTNFGDDQSLASKRNQMAD